MLRLNLYLLSALPNKIRLLQIGAQQKGHGMVKGKFIGIVNSNKRIGGDDDRCDGSCFLEYECEARMLIVYR